MDANRLVRYAADPAAFEADLLVPTASGRRQFGSIMAAFQRERFASINPALLAVAKGEAPPIGKHWWEATKGCSKSTDLAVVILWLLAFSKRPLLCQVGAADQDQAAELRRAARDVLHANRWLAGRVRINKWKLTCAGTGSTCEILAADTAGSQGARPDVLILDELVCIRAAEFAENLADNAAKMPNCLTVVSTNAGFLNTWQYRWREIAQTLPRWLFHQWAQPSPWLNPADVDEARQRNSSSRFARLFSGVWVSGLGDAIDEADIEAAVRGYEPIQRDDMGQWSFTGGLDLGTKRDHAAYAIVARNAYTMKLRLAALWSWKPERGGTVDLGSVRDCVRKAQQDFCCCAVYYDPSQAILMAQDLVAYQPAVPMMEFPFVGKNLNLLATRTMEVFRDRRITLPNDPDLVRDIGMLQIVERSFGFKLESARASDGSHADRAIALALAIAASQEHVLLPYTGPPLFCGSIFSRHPSNPFRNAFS